MEYMEFLAGKLVVDPPTGIEPGEINQMLFPFQADIVRWAIRRGRAAIFAECGTGKTFMQLEWARNVPGNVLILAPLAVAHQTIREAEKLGIAVAYCRDQAEVMRGITISNYERLEKFTPEYFQGVVLDEGSILKSFMGKTKRLLVEAFKGQQFRLICTATPAPNDHMELGNHAEFLGVMRSNEMLSRWFSNNTMQAGGYELKAHGARDFWQWVASWAVALRKPSDIGDYSDEGYVLPPLKIDVQAVGSAPPSGYLFHTGKTLSATEIHQVKRQSVESRAQVVADFANAIQDQCLIWCDTNYESDAIKALLPDAVDVRGSNKDEFKTKSLLDFADGKIKTLVSKPSVAGYGMNFQNCHRVAFIGLSYSFENLYQALRRVWRFGQPCPVNALIVESEAECGIRGVVDRKIKDHERMQEAMCESMKEFQRMDGRKKLSRPPVPESVTGKGWELWHGDCVEVVRDKIADNSIDLSVFSPPFSNLYIYSDSIADLGNSANHDEFFRHFGYLIREIYRITVNGRLCAVHCKDLPAYKGRDGAAGLIDFPGMIIREFERHGWQYHSRVTIWKDPVIEMQRTKNHGLLHKQLCKDSAASRQGMADYMVVFRKWDGDEFPRPVKGPSDKARFDHYIGTEPPDAAKGDLRSYSIQVWQRYASPVWFDIQQTNVLQGSKNATCEEDQKHICPLQLQVIERCIHLWSNEGDTVFSPFTGIGSEGYCAVKMGRKFVGAELKESYFKQATKNIRKAEQAGKQQSLFNSTGGTP